MQKIPTSLRWAEFCWWCCGWTELGPKSPARFAANASLTEIIVSAEEAPCKNISYHCKSIIVYPWFITQGGAAAERSSQGSHSSPFYAYLSLDLCKFPRALPKRNQKDKSLSSGVGLLAFSSECAYTHGTSFPTSAVSAWKGANQGTEN